MSSLAGAASRRAHKTVPPSMFFLSALVAARRRDFFAKHSRSSHRQEGAALKPKGHIKHVGHFGQSSGAARLGCPTADYEDQEA
jgi:hypothetical protein